MSALGTKGRMMVAGLDFQPWFELTFSENPVVSIFRKQTENFKIRSLKSDSNTITDAG